MAFAAHLEVFFYCQMGEAAPPLKDLNNSLGDKMLRVPALYFLSLKNYPSR